MTDTPMNRRSVTASLMSIALPLVGGLAAQTAVQIIDTVMLGRYSVDALAAAVVGTSMLFLFFTIGSGIASAVLAISSGEGGHERPTTLAAGLILSAGFSIMAWFVLYHAEPILLWFGQPAQIAADAEKYLRLAGAGLLPAVLTMTLRSHATALERTQIVFWVSVAALPINAFLNWIFIFGHLGAPEMGIRGAALATLVSHGVSFIATYVCIQRIDQFAVSQTLHSDFRAIARVFDLSWPIAMSNLAELGMFTAITLIVGSMGVLQVASHGIVVQITSAAFIVHLAVSQAATTKLGQAHSVQDLVMMRRVGYASAGLSFGVVALTTCVFVLFPPALVSLFIRADDPKFPAILGLASLVLIVAAISQLMDSMQIVAMGLLRGMRDTKIPMIITVVCYWGLAIPLAFLLGKLQRLDVLGVWIGVATGLLAAAALLWTRFLLATKARDQTRADAVC